MRHSLLFGTDFGSVKNGMIHSQSLLLLHSLAYQSISEKHVDDRGIIDWQMD